MKPSKTKQKLKKESMRNVSDLKGDEKQEALQSALSEIEKAFGKGAVMKLGDSKLNQNIKTYPTGSLSVDIALGIGGFPVGRIIEVFGPESSGKTTLTLHMIAEVQKRGGTAGFIDAEHALDPIYAQKLGVDTANLYLSQPDDGEQALEIAEMMVRSNAIDIIVIDSVAALVPRAEIDGVMGGPHMGLQARLMSQALRKLTGIVSKSQCTVIFINQLREKLNVMFGNPETTTGGRALKFYASIRIDIRKTIALKDGSEALGTRTEIKIVKNKLAPPFRVAEVDMIYGEGISKEGDILDLAIDAGIINKSGSWFSYKETRLGQGREKVKEYLRQNKDFCFQLENEVRTYHKLPLISETGEQYVDDAAQEETSKAKTKRTKTTKKTDAEDEVETDESELYDELDVELDNEELDDDVDFDDEFEFDEDDEFNEFEEFTDEDEALNAEVVDTEIEDYEGYDDNNDVDGQLESGEDTSEKVDEIKAPSKRSKKKES